MPRDWAGLQNNLCNTLRMISELKNDSARLEEAVVAFGLALEERTRQEAPRDWAITQNNLGNALRALGKLEGSTKRLEQAVSAYDLALEVFTREDEPVWHDIVQKNQFLCHTLLAQKRSS